MIDFRACATCGHPKHDHADTDQKFCLLWRGPHRCDCERWVSPDMSNQDHQILGDPQHPDTRDYVATNLLRHINEMPNSGDWWGQLRLWAEANSSGRLQPNRPWPKEVTESETDADQAREAHGVKR